MELEGGLFLDIVIIMVAAFVGGVGARWLRMPILFGYLAVGMVIGPNVLGFVDEIDDVATLAEFGVVLLLFAVGVEISFRDLRKLRNVAVGGGLVQITATIGLGYLIGFGFGWVPVQSAVFGLIISLSSTMVVLKILTDRGELMSLHGRILTGVLLVQDLAFIPMIAILPALQGDGGSVAADLGLGILKATLVLGAMALLGTRAIPWMMQRVARFGSREVFLITLVALTFGAAAVTQSFGLSAALGAFLAGLMLSESDFGHRALSEILPLRDTFSALFFVSLGMLTDPIFLAEHPGLVVAVVGSVIVIKFLLTAGIVRSFKYLPHTAVFAGLGMVQIGEFSFILADAAAEGGVVDDDFLPLIVMSAVLSMALTPGIMALGGLALRRLESRAAALIARETTEDSEGTSRFRNHIVIIGMGRVGSLVAEVLGDLGMPFIGVDMDPYIVARCRERGWTGLHGSGSSAVVLRAARVRQAKVLVIVTADPFAAYLTAETALRINPGLDVVARVHWREEGERLKTLGVSEVVWPEMEAALESLRHSLAACDVEPNEVAHLIGQLRDHLSFETPGSEGVLPPEGLGRDPSATAKRRTETVPSGIDEPKEAAQE